MELLWLVALFFFTSLERQLLLLLVLLALLVLLVLLVLLPTTTCERELQLVALLSTARESKGPHLLT